MLKSRVMYLDIDDTLLIWSNSIHGYAAPKGAEFLKWATEHFEVRWLTMWCPSGKLEELGTHEMSYRFNYKIDPREFAQITNPQQFVNLKTEGIDFNDPRPWVWVEDDILPRERLILREKNLEHNHYRTNVSQNQINLQATWRKLAKRFDLTGPDMPYSNELDMPIELLSVDAIVESFRTRNANRPSSGWSFSG